MSETLSSARHKWLDLLRRQRASGLSVAAFCRRDGVAASSFFAWKRKLGSSLGSSLGSPLALPAFIEATVADSPLAAPPAGLIEVRLRGRRRLRVGRGFDRVLLADLVAALEAIP